MPRSRSVLTAVALLLPLLLLTACTTRPSSEPSAVPAASATAEETATGGGFTDDAVVVPDVHGMTMDEASAALRGAGLEPAERLVHGPIEPGAGPMGEIYAQEPPAGAMVPAGTKVTISSWWERE